MVTKVWNGATAPFNTDADWSGGAPPNSGDTAAINSGVVTVTGALPAALRVNVSSSNASSPTLALTDAEITAGDVISIVSNVTDATLAIAGQVTNRGSIVVSGTSPVLRVGGSGSATTFTNNGGILVNGSGVSFSPNGTSTFVNNGIVSLQNTASTAQSDSIFQTLTGTGSVRLSGTVGLTLVGTVGAGQTIAFEPGAGILQINSLDNFKGTLQGLSSNDDVFAFGLRWDSVAFAPNATGGVLNFSANGAQLSSLAVSGAYSSLADFTLTQSAGTTALSRTEIKTSAAEAPARFAFNDANGGVSGTDPGTAYSGPVSYLQSQYIWSGSDGVNLSASAGNVFLHGGTGDDALTVNSGSNVLDGGAGSNFLTGASGADGGTDTFFLDERGGQVTWSTLLNFHQGDALTIFGFTPGTSTLPFTDGEGAAGFTGATFHSEINGAGTGVNGSVTFAGFTVADVQNKFSTTTGSVGGANYLYIYNHG